MPDSVSVVIASALIALAGCTILGQGVDAPLDVGAEYAAREAAMMKDSDRCGPEFVQKNLPASVRRVIGPIADGPFQPVCGRHDACYRLGEKTQAWCDDRMHNEMLAICQKGGSTPTYAIPVIGGSLCRFHAAMYFTAINNTYGGYAYGTEAGGEITDIRVTRIDDVIGDDELIVCADVLNPTLGMQEYDIELHDARGRLIDREPDTYEVNVRAGETTEFCVSTNYTRWGISDLGNTVYISIRADAPDSFAFVNDMVIVATREVMVPQ